ncbi:MAG: FeoB-associated Cys-rich membrane protein [Lachnospiraceae bacterium]|nr:FeoB-associated Cys-rich membrane protein [Lachnospiraceae bacterium]
MISWLIGNIGTIAVLIVLAIIVTGIVFSFARDKKRGKSACGCNCANCKMCTSCQSNKKEDMQ